MVFLLVEVEFPEVSWWVTMGLAITKSLFRRRMGIAQRVSPLKSASAESIYSEWRVHSS